METRHHLHGVQARDRTPVGRPQDCEPSGYRVAVSWGHVVAVLVVDGHEKRTVFLTLRNYTPLSEYFFCTLGTTIGTVFLVILSL